MATPPSITLTTPVAPFAAFQVVNAGVYALNGIAGYVHITGAGNVVVGSDGNKTIIISGLAQSGAAVTQGQLDSLSGWSASATNLAATGSYLFSLISGGGVSSINGTAGPLTFAGTGAITITQQGSSFIVSGVSGVTPSNLASTGQQAWVAGENNALNLSGGLTATGATLFARDTSISGGLEARLSLSGYTTILYASGASGGLQAQLGGFATNVTVAATGQQAWTAADTNARNLSGNLTQTGVLLEAQLASVSGGLQVQISASGASAETYTNTVSGGIAASVFATGAASIAYGNATFGTLTNLTATGATLNGLIVGLSGQSTLDYATKIALASTGQQAWLAAQTDSTNLSGSLFSTGAALGVTISSVSGGLQAQVAATGFAALTYSNATFATIPNLAATGALLSAVKVTGSNLLQVANFSGLGGTLVIQSGSFVLISGAAGGGGGVTQAQLDSLSGYSASAANLFTTGATLVTLNLSTSGALVSLISAAAAGVSTINGLSGVLTLAGAGGNLFVSLSGQTVYVSGSGIAQTSSLVATGGLLVTSIANVSGGLQSQVFATGAAGVAYANATFATITNLGVTGSTLYGLVAGLSGQSAIDYATKIALASTGQQAWNAATNNGLNLSGNLTQTGINLAAAIATSGAAAVAYTDTRVAATGAASDAYTNAVSGGLQASVFATGAATIAYGNTTFATIANLSTTGGNLSAVKVTGSSIIPVANLSGIGGTLVLLSGGFVLISGSAGAAGVVDHGDGINLSGQLTLTGQTLLSAIASTGQQAWTAANNNGINLSGNLNALSGNLTQTGINLAATIASVSGGLQTQIFASGAAGITYGNNTFATLTNLTLTGQTSRNNDLNLSGSLFTTGANLGTTIASVSGGVQAQIFATGAAGVAYGNATFATLVNVTLTGQTAQNNALNISGNLSATGNSLYQRDLSISGALAAQIVASAAGVSMLNGLSGSLTIGGAGGNLFTSISGQTLYISGSGIAQASISGALASQINSGVVSINRQTASYTLTSGDWGKWVQMDVGAANVLTVPSLTGGLNVPTGAQILIEQLGTGLTTISPFDTTVTIHSRGAALKMAGQYAVAALVMTSGNCWNFFGDIST